MKCALGLFWICLATLTACGSSDDDGEGGNSSCPRVAACGGDVLGKWSLTEACNLVGSATAELDDCPEATAQTVVERANGTLIFDKDTYSREIEFLATVEMRIPSSCKPKLELDDCGDLSGPVEEGINLFCSTESDGACFCEAPVVTQARESGVYRARSNRLELASGHEDYCVQGDVLTTGPRAEMNMGMGTVTLELRATARKQ